MKILIFGFVFFASIGAQTMEATALKELLINFNKPIKDHCDLGEINKRKKVYLRDFFAGYIKWSLLNNKSGDQSFKCRLVKNTKTHSCRLNYGMKAKKGEHPGWDIDLEFKYKNKKIVWKSVQCVSTP